MPAKKVTFHRRHVDTATVDETVVKVADRMRQRHVGTVIVIDRERRPIGIVTDRDLVVRVLAKRRDPEECTVGDVMTKRPVKVTETGARDVALILMKDGGFRRMPVVDADGKLVGVISLDDIVRSMAYDLSRVGAVLDEQRPEALHKPRGAGRDS